MSRGDAPPPHSRVSPPPRTFARGLRNEPVTALMLIASLWLFVGAWVLGYPFNEPAGDAHLTEIIIGIVVFCVAVARLVKPRGRASDLVVLAGGAWLIVAPFAVSYGDTAAADAARVNDIAVGGVLVVLSAVSLILARTVSSRSRRPAAHSGGRRGR
ncbi:SPW repeat domain-containing protein [Streptomyces pratensis]|uniref:SPW repeat domain-containing protein n=1 Tax=Streptomyces pratensis TaxID=1169025 RepID=UPI00301722FE